MQLRARRADVALHIAGVEATELVTPGLLSLCWTDQAGDKADDLTLSLEDRDDLWKGAWRPAKGDPVQASLLVRDWFAAGGDYTLPCGSFEVDEVECSGPPDIVRIKCCSTAVSSHLRRERKTRAWENVTLQGVAAELAGKNGLAPLYEAPAVQLGRVDQREESDLAFLQRLAGKYGLHLKVSDTQLIMYSGQAYDAKSPVAVLRRGEAWINRFSFRDQAGEQFKDCEVAYWDPEEKAERRHRYRCPGDAPSGQTCKINERVESLAEAEVVAQNRLRQANQSEVEGSLDLAGDPRLVAGCTVQVAGFGGFDGSYFIEQAAHGVSRSSGYTTRICIRKTLEY